jgi:hypothetical protein
MKKSILSFLPINQNRTNISYLKESTEQYYKDTRRKFSCDDFYQSIDDMVKEQVVCRFDNDIVATRYGFLLYKINEID